MKHKPSGWIPTEDIVSILLQRQRDSHPLLKIMIDVRDRYNGPQVDYVVPYLLDQDVEEMNPMTPMIMAEAIDNVAMRASSVLPQIYVPAVDVGKETGVRSREYARARKIAVQHALDKSRFGLIQRRMYRHLAAYATTSLVVMPDHDHQIPRLKIRDPLTSFPDITAAEDYDDPENAGFIFGKSASWLREYYPQCRREYGGPVDIPKSNDEIWDCFEWIDCNHTVIGILGPRADAYQTAVDVRSGSKWMELNWWENRSEVLPAVVPARVTLDRIISQVGNIVGHVDLMSKMMQLNVIAAERAVFPDTYIVASQGRTPSIIGGRWKDGREGQPNLVADADQIGRLTQSPDPAALQMLDRLERNVRVSTGLVPQFGGETYGALRTGRGIDSLMGAAVDPRVQELQEIAEAWLPNMVAAMLSLYKGHWGSKSYSLYSGRIGSAGQTKFVPNDHVETLESTVRYSVVGADVVETNVILQQMRASGAISSRTLRYRHPWIDDPDQEQSFIDEERMEEMLMASLQQQAMQGALPPVMLSYIEEGIRRTGNKFEAVRLADQRMRELQATPVEPDPGTGMPPPEAMPGLAGGPMGASQPMAAPPTIAPTPDQEGLREVMNAIAASNRRI